MKIYLSGPITGNTNYLQDFIDAADHIKMVFPHAEILSPPVFCDDIPEGSPWEVYMDRCVKVLVEEATHIHMLQGWKESRGACSEYYLAKVGGKHFI